MNLWRTALKAFLAWLCAATVGAGQASPGEPDLAREQRMAAESVDEKMSVLDSMVMMDDAREMALDILRTESDPRLQVHAIHVLGVMGSDDEDGELYDVP